MIQVSDVSKFYGDAAVLDRVALTLEKVALPPS